MIIRRPPKRRVMRKLMVFFWLLSAVAVYLVPAVETDVAKFQQQQRILAIEDLERTDSSLDVVEMELGNPADVLTIPSISLKLPIHDGTPNKILEDGVRITEETGNTTGGNGGNPLVARYSGLYKNNLFDDLPSVKKGQKFSIKVSEEQHAYQIYRIGEVKTGELRKNYLNYLMSGKDQDRITLMTCTPKSVSSYHFLVCGERVSFSREDLKLQKKAENRKSISLDRQLALLFAFFAFLLFLFTKKIRRRSE